MPFLRFPKSFFFLLLALVGLLAAFAPPAWQQNGVINKIVANLTTLHNKYPQEKVYLHLDKPYCAAGEDIWFKAYLVNAQNHQPSDLSKVLYVELITPENTFYKTSVVRLDKGKGHGDFALPDDLPEGTYRLRAFTSWMQNFDEAYFFHQNITIWSPRKTDVVTSTAFTFKPQPSGDSVLVNLRLQTYAAKPLAQTSFSYSTNFDKKGGTKKTTTSAEGKSFLRLFLPHDETSSPKLFLTLEQPGGNLNRTIAIPTPKDQLDLQFFPEGGNLVGGLWNVVGFKAVDANGLGKDVQGAIYNQQGQKVVDFKSLKFGMGRIGFIPEAGQKYTARLTAPKSVAKEYPLPVPQKKGFIFSIDNKTGPAMRVKFYSLGFKQDSVGKPKALHLVAQVRGEVLYAASSPTAHEVFQVEVPKNKFPSGLVQFTVFSDTGEPLAERLVFVNHGPQVQMSITPDKPAYKPREKVTLQVQAKDETGAPVAGNFSLAITDQKTVTPAPHAANLVSYLLLSSDLKGHVEDPSYYFSSAAPEVVLALDNLLLTQGWRRFVWKDILQDKFPQMQYRAERDLYVSGTVSKITGQPDAYSDITLMNGNNPMSAIKLQTDDRGKFQFSLASFPDTSTITVQTTKGVVTSMLELDNNLPQIPAFPQVPYEPVPAPYSNEVWAYLQRNREQLKLDQFSGKSGIMLQQVNVRGKKQEEFKPAAGSLHSTADRVLRGSELPRGMDIIQALQGRVAGLQVSNGQVSMRGGGPPLFLLDGTQIDASFIQTLNPNDVEAVEILKPGASSAVYGSRGGNGVIAITSKKGGDKSDKTATAGKMPGMATYQGLYFQKAREFYLPRYDKPDTSNVVMPDLRTTLYWNPKVQTDATGKAEITFFTADQKTTYRAILEGMTTTGKMGSMTATFQVK
ncbi:TonB-dependent receptor plug domain-containing protein [Rufibacter sediminis]|uniref:TonB-dependent receptor plug domain-containing protein n=1 Tax=Rufibacter sediminis TaxID=2762756 RepID=A0ABR6VRC9_9BACT|nr:TonB-dependent receptor plug domain-containing protein [Rufibacter sediminis]MBC3539467.1 TonB-dependent receptor plug domain-containing protein [Rufibacter sediminis]